MRVVQVTAPVCEPVSMAEAKLHARIDESADNQTVTALISAARQLAERFTNRVFITQTWKLFLDEAPCSSVLELPKAPLQSVTHVKGYDDADTATTLAASNYFVDANSKPGRVVLRTSGNWPVITRVANGFEVQFICGYGDAAENVPAEIRQAILLIIAHLYEHRGDASVDMPAMADVLLTPHKLWVF